MTPQIGALPHDFPRDISRETIAALPILEGWDTETRPTFRKGEVYRPSRPQAATARAVYVIALQKIDASADSPGSSAQRGSLRSRYRSLTT